MKAAKKGIALFLICVFFCTAAVIPVAADNEAESVRVYYDGLLTAKAYRSGDTDYISAGDLCTVLGLHYSEEYSEEDGTYTLLSSRLEIDAVKGNEYLIANSRYVLNSEGFAVFDGRVYFPVESMETVFGISAKPGLEKIELEGDMKPIVGGDFYYDTFSETDLFWLARIIRAEAGGQPLSGRIGVGNVVMNRVYSADFPSAVYDVIFDKGKVYQFDPVNRGTVYYEPDELSIIAAYMTLDGVNTVGGSLYFLNPKRASDSWFKKDLHFVATIGDHDFYM